MCALAAWPTGERSPGACHAVRTAKILGRHLQAEGGHRGPGLLQRHARLQPRDDVPIVPGEIAAHPRREGDRSPQSDVTGRQKIEVAGHHADDLVRLIVQKNLTSQNAGRSAEPALPEPIAEHHDAGVPIVFLLCEDPSQQGADTQDAPKIPRGLASGHLFGLTVARQRRPRRLSVCNVGEYGVKATPFNPLRRSGVVLGHHVGVRHVVPNHDEAAGIGVWKRTD